MDNKEFNDLLSNAYKAINAREKQRRKDELTQRQRK